MSQGLDIAKAGWLHRQSSVLKRWKKNWFVLYRDGLLRYFESPDAPRAEEVYVVRSVCARIKTGPEVGNIPPPEDVSSGKACMLEMEMRDGNHLVLCAESFDDMKAWQIALEEARTMQPPGGGATVYHRTVPMVCDYSPYGIAPVYGGYTGYGGYPGQVIAPPPAQVIQTPNGMTTFVNPAPATQVVYVDDAYPYRYRHRGYYGGVGYPMFWW